MLSLVKRWDVSIKNLYRLRPSIKVSSRNSEVIHAGLYYPPDSLKTKLCILGKKMLVKTCTKYSLPWNNIGNNTQGHFDCIILTIYMQGKWVIAQNAEEAEYLGGIHKKAQTLGVPTHFISREEHEV